MQVWRRDAGCLRVLAVRAVRRVPRAHQARRQRHERGQQKGALIILSFSPSLSLSLSLPFSLSQAHMDVRDLFRQGKAYNSSVGESVPSQMNDLTAVFVAFVERLCTSDVFDSGYFSSGCLVA